MGTFKYRAKKGPQEIVESEINAASKEEAVEKISRLGYLPVKVEELLSAGQIESGGGALCRGRLRSRTVTVFSRQLSTLLKSGVPILNALSVLTEQSEERGFKSIMREIRDGIKNGRTLSEMLALFPSVFSPVYVALVRSGEESGTLEKALLRIADYRYKQEKLFSNIRAALMYPLLMAVVGAATIIFMLTFVMPRLYTIFARFGQELPLPTQILVNVSTGLQKGWGWIAAGFVLMVVLAKIAGRSKAERLMLHGLALRLPLFGEIFLKAELARFSRTMELLLRSGIQLIRAVETGTATLGNEYIREKLAGSIVSLEQGDSFGLILKRFSFFPKFMINLICVGEESGKLDEALQEIADTYELETDEALKIMTTLVEPLMILVMGAVIGFMIIAMLLPVFELNLIVG